jgi:radical SAM protein with 4Fe4S-binding SPASM domain
VVTTAARNGRTRWLRRITGAISGDLRGLRAAVSRRLAAKPSLRAYDIQLPSGHRCLHFRTHADGSAVLLIDATDAIHLNPTAAHLTRSALDGLSVERAAALLRGAHRGIDWREAVEQAKRVYRLVDCAAHALGCPTCALHDAERAPWFSVPVAAPYKADLALTYGCNNACSHCYNRETSGDRRNGALSRRQWRQVLRRLAEIGVPHVIFTGGEPTLCDDLLDLIRAAGRLRFVTGLNTNGRRLSDARFTASLRAADLDHVQITLESHRPEVHNLMTGATSFDETVAGVQNALAAGLHTLTNTTLTHRNIAHVGKIVDFLAALGLRNFAMNGMIHAGHGRGHGDALPAETLAPALIDVRDRAAAHGMRFLWYTPTEYCRLSPVELELGPRRCNAGEYSMCIEPNGDVLPCQSYYVSAGNILRDPWERIWQSELFLSFRRRTDDPHGCGLPERCWLCHELPVCAGGCRLEREASSRFPTR